jgi:thiamine-monophosphate kinase
MGLMLGRNRAASACMDLSDGLADGVRQIAEASGVGIIVEAGALPIDPCARAWFDVSRDVGRDELARAITGGDDYELLFTVPPKGNGRLRSAGKHADVGLTRIGVCTRERDVILRRSLGSSQKDEALPRGYQHFR